MIQSIGYGDSLTNGQTSKVTPADKHVLLLNAFGNIL
jgi:hypothetical protein